MATSLVVLLLACHGPTPRGDDLASQDASSLAVPESSVPGVQSAQPGFESEILLELDDGLLPPLVRPIWVAPIQETGLMVADFSDRDIKIYGAQGQRVTTVGSGGYGVGEFAALTSAFENADVVTGFDFRNSRLTSFDQNGRVTRTRVIDAKRNGNPVWVRLLNDSLILAVFHPIEIQSRALLQTLGTDGEPVASFLQGNDFFGDDVALRELSNVVADGTGECVYAALSGADTLLVFDVGGRLLASGIIDPGHRWRTLNSFLSDRVAPRGPFGFPVQEQLVAGVVALPGCRAAVQVGRYPDEDGKRPPFPGGDVHLIGVARGRLVHEGSLYLEGPLIGRDNEGNPLFVTRPDTPHGNFKVHRIKPINN